MKKRFLAVVLSLVMLAAVLPCGALAEDENGSMTLFASNVKICGVDIGIAANTHMQFTTSNGTNSESGYYYKGKYLGASQCFGFARWCQYKLFGVISLGNCDSKYTENSSKDFYRVSANGATSVAAGSLTTTNLKAFINASKPGAHLRTNSTSSNGQHSLVITEITDKGFSIAQCNGSNNNEYSGYKQNYVGTYTYTWSSYVSSTYGKRGISYIEMPYKYKYGKPANPTITSATASSSSSITVKWGAVSGATKYRIDRRKASEDDYKTLSSSLTSTSYTDSGLVAGSTYYYRVYAINSAGSSAAYTYQTHTKPAAPTISKVSRDSDTQLTVAWGAVSGASKYKIEYRRGDTSDYTTLTSSYTSTTYTHSGLKTNAKYFYRVTAVREGQVGNDGDRTTKNIYSAASSVAGNFTKISHPSVSIDNDNTSHVILKWSKAIGGGNYAYDIYRKAPSDSGFSKITRTSDVTYTDKNLVSGVVYKYRIVTINTDAESTCTQTDDFYAGPKVTQSITLTPESATSMLISWNSLISEGGFTYTVRKWVDGAYADIANTNNTYYVDSGLSAGQTYQYYIQYRDTSGNFITSSFSNSAVLEILPTAVTLDRGYAEMTVNETLQLYATVAPGNTTNNTVTWSSSDESVATVSNGTVTAKAAGTATITATTSNGKTASCDVTCLPVMTVVDLGEDFIAYINYAVNGKYVTREDNSDVQLRSFSGGLNQVWHFIRQLDGSYKIISEASDDYNMLDVSGWGIEPGTNVGTYYDNDYIEGNSSSNQRWYIIDSNGKYRLKPQCSACMLDVAGGGDAVDGTQIQMWTYLEYGAQEFYINKIEDTEAPTIYDVSISDITSTGYTVSCKLSDNVGVKRVKFPTWTESNWQDDIVWHEGTISGDTATCRIDFSEHNGESGIYITHIYAYDAVGNYLCYGNLGAIPINGGYEPVAVIYDGNKKYLLFENEYTPTWIECKQYCERIGGYLATITSEAEQKTIEELMSKGSKDNYFIGGCENSEDVWKWVTGEEWNFTNWAENQPDNKSEGEKFLRIFAENGQWDDIYILDSGGVGFICEIELSDPAPEATYTAALTVGTVSGRAGEKVTVPITISENPGIAGFNLVINYDKNLLTPVSIEKGSALTAGTLTSNIQQGGDMASYDAVTAYWVNPENVTADGEILKVTFEIAENAEEGEIPVTVTYEDGDVTNRDYDDIALDITDGYVTVINILPGDVYQDGIVNTKDGVRLSQYLAKWDVNLTNAEEKAADVYQDGVINTKDGVRLSQYLAKWDVTLGQSTLMGLKLFSSAVVGFEVGKASAKAGEYVDLPVYITKNTGVAGFNVQLNYDKALLTPVSITQGAALTSGTITSNIQQGGDLSRFDAVTVYWVNPSNITSTGEAFTVRFKVAETAEGEIPVKISYDENDVPCDQNLAELNVELTDGSVVTERSETQLDYTVNYLSVTDAGASMRVKASVTKNTDREGEDAFVIAVYEDDILVDMLFIEAEFAKGQTASVGGFMKKVEGATIKAFVWDGIDSMITLSNTIEK